jgi:23S rRNA (uridine2552-2'-O)-methyltransferase
MHITSCLAAAKKTSASSSRWLARARADPFRHSKTSSSAGTTKAHPRPSELQHALSASYVSRSAHKLVELEAKYRFLKRGSKILDLGAAPGGWTQVCLDRLDGKGRVIGVDLLDLDTRIASRPDLHFIKGDLREAETLALLDAAVIDANTTEEAPHVNVVLSDMLGNTTGNTLRDSQTSLELCDLVVEISQRYLTYGDGTVIFKIFQSGDADAWRKEKLEKLFKKISIFKPFSSRKESREVYYVCKSRR